MLSKFRRDREISKMYRKNFYRTHPEAKKQDLIENYVCIFMIAFTIYIAINMILF